MTFCNFFIGQNVLVETVMCILNMILVFDNIAVSNQSMGNAMRQIILIVSNNLEANWKKVLQLLKIQLLLFSEIQVHFPEEFLVRERLHLFPRIWFINNNLQPIHFVVSSSKKALTGFPRFQRPQRGFLLIKSLACRCLQAPTIILPK